MLKNSKKKYKQTDILIVIQCVYCTDYQPPHSSTDTITAIVYHAVSDDELRVELNQLIKC